MPHAEKITFRQERDFGDVLNITFQFLRQNVKLLAKSLFFIAGPAFVLSVIVNPMSGASGLFFNPAAMEAMNTDLGGSSMALFFTRIGVGVLLNLLGLALATAVVNEFVVLYQDRGPGRFEVEDVWRQARRSVWKVIGTWLLFGLLFGVSLVIVLVPCIGALAYFAGFIYLSVVLALVFITQSREGAGVLESLSRSRTLVQDNWWLTAGVLFVAGFVYQILASSFAMPAMILNMVAMFHGMEVEGVADFYRIPIILFTSIAALGGLMLYAVPLTAAAFQYFSLVEHREKAGLMERVEAIAQAAQRFRETSEEEATPDWQPPRGPIAPGMTAPEAASPSTDVREADVQVTSAENDALPEEDADETERLA